jgi:hypothetical protein
VTLRKDCKCACHAAPNAVVHVYPCCGPGSEGWPPERIVRPTWVLVTNGLAVYILYGSTRRVALLNHLLEQDNKAVWFHFAVLVTIPILGILLEFLGSRFAKSVNIGYLVFAGTVFSAVGIWTWPDHHGLTYLLLGPSVLAFAAVTWLLYRRPRPAPAV